MDRADDAAGFRAATRPWHVPTFTVVFADDRGHTGVQITGRVPLRREPERGYRPGWEPAQQWPGPVPLPRGPPAVGPPPGLPAPGLARLGQQPPGVRRLPLPPGRHVER